LPGSPVYARSAFTGYLPRRHLADCAFNLIPVQMFEARAGVIPLRPPAHWSC